MDNAKINAITKDLQSAIDGLNDYYFDMYDVDSVIDLPQSKQTQLNNLQSVLDDIMES